MAAWVHLQSVAAAVLLIVAVSPVFQHDAEVLARQVAVMPVAVGL